MSVAVFPSSTPTTSMDHFDVCCRAAVQEWKIKYNDVNDILMSTKADLDDFQISSKELEEELERELESVEKTRAELLQRVERVETDRDEWKAKFISLQTTYNNTTNLMQRELDSLRKSIVDYKTRLVELELGNDDLERNERAVASTLTDLEAKFARKLEESTLMETELQHKATLEEECQRLRDELRDLNSEVSVMKEIQSRSPMPPPPPLRDETKLAPLSLAELTMSHGLTTPPEVTSPTAGQSAMLSRAGFASTSSSSFSSSTSSLAKSISSVTVTASPSRLPTPGSRKYAIPDPTTPTPLGSRTNMPNRVAAPTFQPTFPKSRGITMVNDMRAKTRALQVKIGGGLPRLRLNSLTRGPHHSPQPYQHSEQPKLNSSRSNASSPGWVLVNEAPPPPVERPRIVKAHSRASMDSDRSSKKRASPPPSAFRTSFMNNSTSILPSLTSPTSLNSPAVDLPCPSPTTTYTPAYTRAPSRLSVTSSTFDTTSHTSTPSTSRPVTPTMIPVPASLKRSGTGRRSSLGTSNDSNGSSTGTIRPPAQETVRVNGSRIGRPSVTGSSSTTGSGFRRSSEMSRTEVVGIVNAPNKGEEEGGRRRKSSMGAGLGYAKSLMRGKRTTLA